MFDKSLRENMVFSDHSLATDSVFAEVQLVSCRNVLIYFDRVLQDRAVSLFRDALVRRGFLGIGSKRVALYASQLDFMRDEDGNVHAITQMTTDQLKDLPEHVD